MDITFGSVCSGIEAASAAFHPLGWKASWLSEIDAFASAYLAHHYPSVPNLGDMTQLPQKVRAGQVHAPDVLCGGTPCQAFSLAGLRKSLDDDRGNLTLTFCDLANAIDQRRAQLNEQPAVILWENVFGVLSTKDNAFGCFLGALAGEDGPLQCPTGQNWGNAGVVFGPQRAVAWRILDAQHFGVAQRRRRVFVVASAREGFNPAEVLFEFEGVRRDSPPSREAGQEVAGSTAPISDSSGAGELIAFGGNRTSGPIDVTPALLAQPGSGWKGDFESETFVVEPLPFDTTQLTNPLNMANPKRGDPCHPLSASAHPPAIAFHPEQDPVNGEEICHSLGGNNSATAAVVYRGVRRLMPIECERLMGFPDNATAIPWRGKPAEKCPDGLRYRALGNSWAVPVAHWVGRRIDEALSGGH